MNWNWLHSDDYDFDPDLEHEAIREGRAEPLFYLARSQSGMPYGCREPSDINNSGDTVLGCGSFDSTLDQLLNLED